MISPRDEVLMRDIIEAIDAALGFIANIDREDLRDDRKTAYALIPCH